MELFKNKDITKITHLSKCSSELRKNSSYVIWVVQKFGIKELKYADPELIKDFYFWELLVNTVPQAIALLKCYDNPIVHVPHDLIGIDETGKPRQTTQEDFIYHLFMKNPTLFCFINIEEATCIRSYEDYTYQYNKTYTYNGKSYYREFKFPKENQNLIEYLDTVRPDAKELYEHMEESRKFEDSGFSYTKHLETASQEERNNMWCVEHAVFSHGIDELKYADKSLLKKASFWVFLLQSIPEAAALIPNELSDYPSIYNRKLGTKNATISGSDLAKYIYLHINPKIYKYLPVEIANSIRELESKQDNVEIEYLGFKHKLTTYSSTESNPNNYVRQLDKMRPDVKEYADSLEEGVGV